MARRLLRRSSMQRGVGTIMRVTCASSARSSTAMDPMANLQAFNFKLNKYNALQFSQAQDSSATKLNNHNYMNTQGCIVKLAVAACNGKATAAR